MSIYLQLNIGIYVYFDLQRELVLFLSHTISVAIVYMAVQKLETELSNFYLCQF